MEEFIRYVNLKCDIDYALALGEGRQRENSKMCSLLARVLAESKRGGFRFRNRRSKPS